MRDIGIGIIIGLALAAIACAWIEYKPRLPAVLAPPAKELAGETTSKLACQPVLVYRDKLKQKVGLPQAVQADPGKRLVASVTVPADDRPSTVSGVYDASTGAVDLYRRIDPLPWLDFNRRATLGAAYGAKNDTSGFVTRVYGRYDLAQIKMLHAGLLGDVDNAGGWYGGGFAEVRW